MTVYTVIPNGDIDQDSPITQPLLTALRDNVLAIQEGDTTAPKILPRALDLYLGDVTFTGTTAAGLSSLTGIDGIFFWWSGNNTSGASRTMEVRFSNDNGTTWGAYQTFVAISGASTTASHGFGMISLTTGQMRATSSNATAQLSATYTVPANTNAFQFRYSAATATGDFKVFGFGATS